MKTRPNKKRVIKWENLTALPLMILYLKLMLDFNYYPIIGATLLTVFSYCLIGVTRTNLQKLNRKKAS